MKIIINLNTFALALPFIFLFAYPFVKEAVFFFSMLSTMVTGFIQVVLALILLIKEPKNVKVQLYLMLVLLFFLLWYINDMIGYNDVLTLILFMIPAGLALFLSVIIYKKQPHEP